jgi:hypothetical protein
MRACVQYWNFIDTFIFCNSKNLTHAKQRGAAEHHGRGRHARKRGEDALLIFK